MKKLLFLFLLFTFSNLFAKDVLNVGVLAYGTVNWELETIKNYNLDKKNGFDLQVKKIASKNGVAVSFMANEVDMIVNDFVWVNRQNTEGEKLYFYPHSSAVGAIYVRDNNINSIVDLKDKKLGIAGGSVDKSWLLFQAYTKKQYGIDLKNYVLPTFAAPPILNAKIEDGSLQGVLNFWHYNTRLEDMGYKKLISLNEILPKLGIDDNSIAFIGWVFKDEFAKKDKELVTKFLKASDEAKEILKNNKDAWEKIKPLMDAPNKNVENLLIKGYIDGIPTNFNETTISNMQKLYDILNEYGGKNLVGDATTLNPDIFWKK